MVTTFTNVFSSQDIAYLNQHPEVLCAKAKAKSGSDSVYFTVPLTPSLRSTLTRVFDLDLRAIQTVPMRWITGDTKPHIDVGSSNFAKTHLVYLTDSNGVFVVGDATYPITQNTGFVFAEGTSHKTLNTGSEPRLLLGPMSEVAFPVGSAISIEYYPTATDALNLTNMIGQQLNNYTLEAQPGYPYTSWRIAANSAGPSSKAVVYPNGETLDSTGTYTYFVYPATPCFLEGSKILCLVDGVETYVPVQHLKPGTLVKTALNGYKKVALVGKGTIVNDSNTERTENRLYRCRPTAYPELTEDLIITGCHSILVSALTADEREKTIKKLGATFVTDKKYRLMACIDERAEPVVSHATYPIYHFALENDDPKMNYGVYANGLLVESCSLNFLKNKSNMAIL